MRVRPGLRLRLAGTVFAAGCLVAVAALLGLMVVVDLELDSAVDAGLRARASDVVAAVMQDDTRVPADDPFAQVVTPDGRVVGGTANAQAAPVLSRDQLQRAAHVPITVETNVRQLGGQARVRAEPAGRDVVAVGTGLTDFDEVRDRLLVVLATALVILVLLLTAGAWVVVGAALRPVGRMSLAASEMSGTDPHGRLPQPSGSDELALLSRTFNGLLERIDAFVQRERTFLDDASHELRTPLTVLRGELELAADDPDPEGARRGVRVALSEAERLSTLASDLLVLARQRGGDLELQCETVELAAWLHRLAAAWRSTTHVGIAVDAPRPAIASIDPTRMERVLINLVNNAAAAGAAVVMFRLRSNGVVVLEVSDDGSGFDPDILPRAFERFSRTTSSQSAEEPPAGAGLGLAIVAALVDAHGGRVTADNHSELGGARLRIELPHPQPHSRG